MAKLQRKPPPMPKFETSDPGFKSGFADYSKSRCPSDLSQNVVDALSCWHQSLRQVWHKSAVDCMRNANKCPKIPILQ